MERNVTEKVRERVQTITTPAGDPAWLVTGYDEVKQLLNDRRLRRSHPDPANAPRHSVSALFGGPMLTVASEPAHHAAMRLLLTPSFSAQRMESLRHSVDDLVNQLLDDMQDRGAPADFHEAVSFPLPALVISDLLGVPAEDRSRFRRWSEDAADVADGVRSQAGWTELQNYMHLLLDRKRLAPGTDVLSDLVRAQAQVGGAFSDDQIGQLGAGLLFAGHETTVNAIDRGMLLLLTNASERERLARDGASLPKAVEEILRMPNPVDSLWGSTGVIRYAASDIEAAGHVIKAGDLVVLSLQAANLDDTVFRQPEAFNIARDEAAHLAFGYGAHYCIGAPLARLELQALFAIVFRRFPTLRLSVPLEAVQVRERSLTRGVTALPVTW